MNRFKFVFLLLLVTNSCFFVQAGWGPQNADSNNSDILYSKTDQFEDLLQLSGSFRNSSLKKSIESCRKAVRIAEEMDIPELKARAYKFQGVNYYFQGDNDSSLYYYQKAIPQFEAIGAKVDVGKVLGNIGLLYKRQEMFGEAMEYYMKNLAVYEEMGFEEGMGKVYNNLGNLYNLNEDWEAAKEHYLMALKVFEKYKDSIQILRALNNLGVNSEKIGADSIALEYYQRALEVNQDIGDKRMEAKLHLNVGYIFQKKKKYEVALEKYYRTETMREELEDIYGLFLVKNEIADCCVEMGDYFTANRYLSESKKIASENGFDSELAGTYDLYAEMFKKRNRYKDAFEYQEKATKLRDSINKLEAENKFSELMVRYQTDKHRKEVELLSQQSQIQELELSKKNAWLFGLISLILLGVVAIGVSFRINKIRSEHKIMSLQQKVLLTQMNPHFLFNSLSAIQSFILDERNDEANSYLSQLASMVRGVLENSRQEFIPLRQELQTLQDYLEMQNLRFDNKLDYAFEVDEEIDSDELAVPPMLAQPFIENSIKHGELTTMPDAKIDVKISMNSSGETVLFEITDNGIGIDQTRERAKNPRHCSLATSIALDRVKIYNLREAKRMRFEIIDLKNIHPELHGTRVTFHIPSKVI
jgi:tetratricopeptide (TPR) repeat protein